MEDFEIGSKLKIFLFSTISIIQTSLKYSPLFPVSKGCAVEIIGVIVLRGTCPSKRGGGYCPRDNYPTGVMVLGG